MTDRNRESVPNTIILHRQKHAPLGQQIFYQTCMRIIIISILFRSPLCVLLFWSNSFWCSSGNRADGHQNTHPNHQRLGGYWHCGNPQTRGPILSLLAAISLGSRNHQPDETGPHLHGINEWFVSTDPCIHCGIRLLVRDIPINLWFFNSFYFIELFYFIFYTWW